jgi:hypothetical protein
VYSEPGPVPEAEFTDWYDTEHVPARLAVSGFSNVRRFRAADGQVPSWLATYDIAPGTLDGPEYRALAEAASPREKSIMSTATLDRRVYELISDSAADAASSAGAAGVPGVPGVPGSAGSGAPAAGSGAPAAGSGAPAAVMAVALSVPPSLEADLAAWYADEHIPMLLAVPGWRRVRRYRLTAGTAPAHLALHELTSVAVFGEPAYRAAVTTPWRNRIFESSIGRERRVFTLYKAFG